MHEKTMKEFSALIVDFQTKNQLSDFEYAGMLIGAGAVAAARAPISKKHMNMIANKCYDGGTANDA